MSHPRISILSTGGTIASRRDPNTGAAHVVDSGAALLESVPGIEQVAAVTVSTVFSKDSSLITPVDVMQLAQAANAELARDGVDGVVITHGTDTMEESAFLLDLLIKSDKPVVLTGAQLSADMVGADGPRNLLAALKVAADHSSRGRGVMVVFADHVLAARDVAKRHTSQLAAFVSTRGSQLGEVGHAGVQFYAAPSAARGEKRATYAPAQLETDVALLHLAMGQDAEVFNYLLDRGVKGVVLAAFGIGNAGSAFAACIERAYASGVPVAITSRCGAGAVAPVYAAGGAGLAQAGAIFAADLSAEKARLALMVLLGQGASIEEIREQMLLIAA